MEEPGHPVSGLFGGLRRVSASLLATLKNRLELLSVELQEETWRLVTVLIGAGLLVCLAFLGLVLLTFTLVFLAGEEARIWLLAGFTVLYLGGAGVIALFLWRRLKRRPPPFSETISQLRKDASWLQRGK
jgi:uncharacterized membrane protein YqjE